MGLEDHEKLMEMREIDCAAFDNWLSMVYELHWLLPAGMKSEKRRLWITVKGVWSLAEMEAIDFSKRDALTTNYQFDVRLLGNQMDQRIYSMSPCWKWYNRAEIPDRPNRPLMSSLMSSGFSPAYLEITVETHYATVWAESLNARKDSISRYIFDELIPVHGLFQIVLSYLLLHPIKVFSPTITNTLS